MQEVKYSLQELNLGLKIRVLCFTNFRGCMALNSISVNASNRQL